MTASRVSMGEKAANSVSNLDKNFSFFSWQSHQSSSTILTSHARTPHF
jgi:hypothetical protein